MRIVLITPVYYVDHIGNCKQTSLKELTKHNQFYKKGEGSNLDDFMNIHSQKHIYDHNNKSTKNKTQFA